MAKGLSAKKVKQVRKYAKNRFPENEHGVVNQRGILISAKKREKILMDIYKNSSPEKQKMLDKEMEDYQSALDNGLIDPGDSLLKAFMGSVEVEKED